MPHSPILMFDLGGVLVENVGFDRLNALLPSPVEDTLLKERWLASPSVRSFELGLISPEVFSTRFSSEWQLSCSPEIFLYEFVSWPKGFYPGVTELLAQLRQFYKLACLSNSNALHWKKFDGFREHFHVALSSHLLGVIKPDDACFERALQECEASANQVLFFDDSLSNVTSALRLGMQAFHVNGVAEVKYVLEAQGLLNEASA